MLVCCKWNTLLLKSILSTIVCHLYPTIHTDKTKFKLCNNLLSSELLRNVFNNRSIAASWRWTTFSSSRFFSFSWDKIWSVCRWAWSTISTWIRATKQTAMAKKIDKKNHSVEGCTGLNCWLHDQLALDRWGNLALVYTVIMPEPKTRQIFISDSPGNTSLPVETKIIQSRRFTGLYACSACFVFRPPLLWSFAS